MKNERLSFVGTGPCACPDEGHPRGQDNPEGLSLRSSRIGRNGPHGRSDSPPSLGESICRGRIYAALPFAFTIRVAYMRGAAPRSRLRPEREEPPPTPPPRICRVRTTTPSFRRMPESRTGAFLICLDSGIRRNDERRSNPPPLFSGWRGGVFWAKMKPHSEVGQAIAHAWFSRASAQEGFIRVRLSVLFRF